MNNEFCFFKADKDSLIDVVDLNIIEKLYEKFLNKVSIWFLYVWLFDLEMIL